MKTPKMFFDKKKLLSESAKALQRRTPTAKKAKIDLPEVFFDPDNFEAYEKIFSNVVIVDAHTHIGNDKDGHKIDEKRLIKNMDLAQINIAIVFPLNEPLIHNFSRQNDRVLDFYRKHPGRIIPFFRLNPKSKWENEYEKRVLQGFRGIKLHPRSQHFGIASEHAMKIYERAEENMLPVIIHAGFGLDNVAYDIIKVVDNFPKLRLIIGHSAFVDLENTVKAVGKNDNVLFETSTLRIVDLLHLLNSVDYTKIAFGSDVPYYDFDIALEMLVDTAIICNKNPNHIKAILGGNILKWFK